MSNLKNVLSRFSLAVLLAAGMIATASADLPQTRADGVTVIEHAACEPEIQNLADYLNACGAHVQRAADHFVITGRNSHNRRHLRKLGRPDQALNGLYAVGSMLGVEDNEIESGMAKRLDDSRIAGLRKRSKYGPLGNALSKMTYQFCYAHR